MPKVGSLSFFYTDVFFVGTSIDLFPKLGERISRDREVCVENQVLRPTHCRNGKRAWAVKTSSGKNKKKPKATKQYEKLQSLCELQLVTTTYC